MLFGRFPSCRLRLPPNSSWKVPRTSFTLVSQFLQFSGAFGAFGAGFGICFSAERRTHKESNSPMYSRSTQKDQSCSVVAVGVFFVCVALASRCWPIRFNNGSCIEGLSLVQTVSLKTVNLGLF